MNNNISYMKLGDYARLYGITYRTAWNRYNAGKIDGGKKDETGHIIVPTSSYNPNSIKKAAIYCRVSNHNAQKNLDRQEERLHNFASSNGFKITSSFKEIGSGLNDKRTKLNKLLKKNNEWDVLIVENKDRLTRFGFNYIENLLNQMGKEILVVNEKDADEKESIINDLVSIIYSFSAKIYGLRKAKKKSQQQITDFLEKE